MNISILLNVLVFFVTTTLAVSIADDVTVLSVATNITEGYQRYSRSAKVYNIPITTLGLGTQWTGGNMNFAGGGQKINLLKEKLEKMKSEGASDEKLIIFTDSYDVMFLGPLEDIVKKFKSLVDTKVLFSAEYFCWPDESLATEYPPVEGKGYPYLNSGSFMGRLGELYEILSFKPVADKDDDQLYYTQIYLNKELREKLKMRLDHKSDIFQNIYGAYDDVELIVNDSIPFPYIKNVLHDTNPIVLHGNGPSKTHFNSLSNYLAKSWSPTLGCTSCDERRQAFNNQNAPSVLLTIFIEYPTPFIEEFFEKILALTYPKKKMHVFLRNNVPFHTNDLKPFLERSEEYASIKQVNHEDFIEEAQARKLALYHCIVKKCDYVFVIDSIAHLDNVDTLIEMMNTNVPVVAPMLARPGKSWSNFWGNLTRDGFYSRSYDYMDIVHLVRRGVWNVPFINSCYLLNAAIVLQPYEKQITYKADNMDPDMKFCSTLRSLEIFMYISNEKDYGHLIDPETFDITLVNPNLYQIFENGYDWELRYIHPEYSENFNINRTPAQPCPDVYWFPMTSKRFCNEYIEIMEANGHWSDGSNSDARLEGGYEAVPTRDIHTNQVGFEKHWLFILKHYVRPLQELVFLGYFHDPPRSLMNFVVRYKPKEQPSLRPHHDSSTYTINLALNTPGLDYKGGGCRFLRYNCSVTDTRPGWILMHPGRLTHYHEGLLVTEGVRYIMISFIDP